LAKTREVTVQEGNGVVSFMYIAALMLIFVLTFVAARDKGVARSCLAIKYRVSVQSARRPA